jgi:hypothetical protein
MSAIPLSPLRFAGYDTTDLTDMEVLLAVRVAPNDHWQIFLCKRLPSIVKPNLRSSTAFVADAER